MRVLVKASANPDENIIDIFFIDDYSVEGATKRPDTYVEEYQKKFHDFCNDIFNYMQSLERKNSIILEHEMKRKDGEVAELGYRDSTRTVKQESYYIPFRVKRFKDKVEGNPTFVKSPIIQVRMSTHKPEKRPNDVLIEYIIDDWRNTRHYNQHKRAVKAIIDGEIKDRYDSLKR